MASRYIRVQATLGRDSAVAADAAVNTFHFEADAADDAALNDQTAGLQDRLHTFYSSIAQYLSGILNGTVNFRWYNLSDPKPRVPFHQHTLTGLTFPSSVIPPQVAIAVTLKADFVSGQKPARRRGRVYLGPLGGSLFTASSGEVRIDNTVRTNIATAFEAMARGSTAQAYRLAVFSPTTLSVLGTPMGDAFNDVTSIEVDDSPDTQRRRVANPANKTVLPVS